LGVQGRQQSESGKGNSGKHFYRWVRPMSSAQGPLGKIILTKRGGGDQKLSRIEC